MLVYGVTSSFLYTEWLFKEPVFNPVESYIFVYYIKTQ